MIKKSVLRCTVELHSLGYEFYAYGPSLRMLEKGKNEGKSLEPRELLSEVRDIIGKKAWLHILGESDVEVLEKLDPENFNSFDSKTCTVQAKNRRRMEWSEEKNRIINKCALKDEDLKQLQQDNFSALIKCFENKLWKK